MSTRRDFLITAAAAATGGALAAQETRRPNILFFFPDQQRFDWTTLNTGLPLRTPNLEALRGRGIQFTNAFVGSPLCAPSRACLAAGAEYDDCGVASNAVDFPAERTTYYGLLRESGYHVIGCGKLDLHKATEDWGLDGRRLVREWGFSDAIDNAGKHDAVRSGKIKPHDPYMGMLHSRDLARVHLEDFARRGKGGEYADTAPTALPEDAYCDNWLAENGLKLLRAAPKDKPWHLVVNFTGPHSPMDITRRMDRECRGRDFPQPHRSTQFDANRHVAIRQNYSAMVENVDRWLGLYVQELRRRGELDNTLIVYSSDHGDMLGDHDRWGKTLPWEPSMHVPLVVAGPGVKRSKPNASPVLVHDLAATFLDYAGASKPRSMHSESFRPVLEGRSQSHREYVRSGLGSWRAVTDGRYKLIRGYDPALTRFKDGPMAAGPVFLYDLEADPGEDRSLAEKEPKRTKKMLDLLPSLVSHPV